MVLDIVTKRARLVSKFVLVDSGFGEVRHCNYNFLPLKPHLYSHRLKDIKVFLHVFTVMLIQFCCG